MPFSPLLRRASKIAVRPPWRRAAGPAYDALVRTELALERALDANASWSDAALDDLTLMVKTFERPHVLARLLESVRRLYPTLRVIVVDDSRAPLRREGVENIVLPYDSGVSTGRNAGLARVRTEFFVLADDDFVFYRRTRLLPALARLRAHREIDVLGGTVVDLPFFRTVAPRGDLGSIAGFKKRAHIRNFYLARAERVRLVGWNAALKRVDHADFFWRARGVLTVVEDPELRVLHARTPFDARYMAHRNDIAADIALLRVQR